MSATLSDSATEVGQPVELRIEISGGRSLSRVPAPQVDGLNIVNSGQSTNLQLRNFSLNESVIYTFTVYPTRPGTFTIPEQEIQVGTRVLRTPALTLTATAANPGGRRGGASSADPNAPERLVRAELIVPKGTAYVGEAIPAELRLYVSRGARLLEPDQNPQLSGEGFAVSRFTSPSLGQQNINGSPVQVLTYKTVITAAKAGPLTLGPAELTPTVQLPPRRQQRSRRFGGFDDDPFEGLFPPGTVNPFAPAQQVKATTEPVKIEIQPLPAAGQPADFTGAVGRFELLPAEANPRQATAGDPVTVRLGVRGRGSFDRLGAPAPASEDGLRTYPPTDRFKADDDVGLSGTKTFEQTVIPQGARDSLPGYHFSYFDPGAGRYVTLQTPPIPVKIAPGAAPTPAPPAASSEASLPPAATASASPAPSRNPLLQDILHIRSDPGPRAAPDAFLPFWQRRVFLLAQLLPFAILLGLLAALFARARARDGAARQRAALARQREELRRALRNPRTGRREFYDAAARLIELHDRRRIDSNKDGQGERAAALEAVLQRHNELAYSGGLADQEPVGDEERREVLAALAALEKSPAAPPPLAAGVVPTSV